MNFEILNIRQLREPFVAGIYLRFLKFKKIQNLCMKGNDWTAALIINLYILT